MTIFTLTRPTIYQVSRDLPQEESKLLIPDAGRRRHLCFGGDFDARSATLATKIEDHWEDDVKKSWFNNQEIIKKSIKDEFGEFQLGSKIENFIKLDTKPMSVLSYHNGFFEHIRNAYVMGYYYPALVAACALGERILNHLVIDMRPMFKHTSEYRRVHKKQSFADWDVPINTLEEWGVLLPEVVSEFRLLKELRHRSIHFNVSTYETLHEDALASVLHMRTIIDFQFGTWGPRPWFIRGTKGHMFIAKDYETHPFVRTYFTPRFAFVGPLFGLRHTENGQWDVMDVPDYGDGEWTDEEFAQQYNERNPEQVVKEPPEMRWADGVEPANKSQPEDKSYR
nr:hypothetical protein [uncultured Cohaesibacter sp.]